MNDARSGLMDKIQTVTTSAFEALVLTGNGPIAVEFMSYGCGYCRSIEPMLHEVAEMLDSKEQIFRVNIDSEEELSASFDIQGTPTFIMFLDGSEVGRVEGIQPTLSSVMAAVTEPFETQN
jgi:thioredoxin 1